MVGKAASANGFLNLLAPHRAILKDEAYGILSHGQGFFFGVALGNDFGQGRNQNGEAALRLRLKNDRKSMFVCHPAVPFLLLRGT
jgi:hypothetical protein